MAQSGPGRSGAFEFLRHVFPREYREVRARRAAVRAELECTMTAPLATEGEARVAQADALAGPHSLEQEDVGEVRPSTALDLVGLSISGGGIRSATINLGVVQALHSYGLLRHVDYLSTVSGGGYLGSCLSVMMRKPGDPFPFLTEQDCKVKLGPAAKRSPNPSGWSYPETEVVTYLRAHSNYLTPNGLTDQVLIGAVLLRGIFFNLLLVTPVVLSMIAFLSMIYGPWLRQLAARGGPGIDPLPFGQLFLVTPWVASLLALYFLISPLLTRKLERTIPKLREQQANGGLRLPGRLLQQVLDVADGRADERVSWVALRFLLERVLSFGLLAVLAVGAFELQPVFIHYFHEIGTAEFERDVYLFGLGGASALVAIFMGRLTSAGAGSATRVVLLGLIGMVFPVIAYLALAEALIYWPGFLQIAGHSGPAVVIGGSIALYLALYLLVDINEYAPHRSYRDAISRAYLVGIDLDNRLGPEDDLKLSQLSEPGSVVPYHLVNTALNLQGDRRMAHSGRLADVFVFSKHFIGSEMAGYCPTEVVEQVDSHINLGTAMAISAAAASPNMGSFTVGPLVQLLTLFNIRCGYWAPNPERVREYFNLDAEQWSRSRWRQRASTLGRVREAWDRSFWIAGPRYLAAEMTGALDLSRRMVNISDGGHIENLGAYELLKRRVKFLIVLDGEADGAMSFGAMATLARYARLDMGIEIDLNLDPLALHPDGLSRQHAAIGTIAYPARPALGLQAEQGVILYLKSSLTGDEDQILREYKLGSPDFPHESTADQFFDEKQFEAYRSLGYHMADQLLAKAFKDEYYACHGLRRDQVRHVFRRLRIQLESRPGAGGSSARLREQLGRVEALLADPSLAAYVAQIAHESLREAERAPGAAAKGPNYRQQVLLTANAQLRLMEDVFFELDLQERRNREHASHSGWMVLFQRWVSAPDFRWAYALSVSTYGKPFRLFCQYALGLKLRVVWREVGGEELIASGAASEAALLARGSAGARYLIGELWVRDQPCEPGVPVAWSWSWSLDEQAVALASGFEDAETLDLVQRDLREHLLGLG